MNTWDALDARISPHPASRALIPQRHKAFACLLRSERIAGGAVRKIVTDRNVKRGQIWPEKHLTIMLQDAWLCLVQSIASFRG